MVFGRVVNEIDQRNFTFCQYERWQEIWVKAELFIYFDGHLQDRMLSLDSPVKVGRSVARARPIQTNAIFDCKVNTLKVLEN